MDHNVLRPLSHIAGNWEITWNHSIQKYEPEEESFAELLNQLIFDLSTTIPPEKYHDNEDRLAEFVIENLKWPITKDRGRWVGEDYDVILEQGGFDDVGQKNLLEAATGRIYAAIKRDQTHFDEMEDSHRRMLGAVLTIILYHRSDELSRNEISKSGQ